MTRAAGQDPSPAGRGSPLRWVLLLYLALLASSSLVRHLRPDFSPASDQATVELPVVDHGVPQQARVRVAYRMEAGNPERLPVVLLHGSPMASPAMMGLHHALVATSDAPVLTPDLPGFGGSSRRIPDYSVQAHGMYLVELLEALEIPSAHVVAYSMAGGVALEAYHASPDRIASLTMISAIGVQELELTGDYAINHAVHGVQLAALWLFHNAIPHFGYLDDSVLGVPYGRNFFDTDQRPLRDILGAFEPPMLIIHGADDVLVPVGAALEHHRLVPQSRLVLFPPGAGGHGLVFAKSDSLAHLISRFDRDVEESVVPGRSGAAPERVEAAGRPFDPTSIPRPSAFASAILMTLIAVATFVSEDLASIGAGLMAARGTFSFLQAVLAAMIGIVLGDVGLYLMGRWIGRPLLRRAPFRWFITESDLDRGADWFERRGLRAIVISRFVPGTRAPTYVAAGLIRAPFLTFMAYFLVAAALWTPVIVGLSMLLGQQVLDYYDQFERYSLAVLAALIIALLIVFRVAPLLFSHTGRRRLRGRWQRVRRWEFWPPWVFYPPVFLYYLWLALRHRSLSAFTASNPGMPEGGFIGESKASILSSLPPASVARWTLISGGLPAERRLEAAEAFRRDSGLGFPLVLKPDVGERGRGVSIAQSPGEVSAYLKGASGDTIVQEYVPGMEYGIFYARRPLEARGRIISLTDKRFPVVTGDGVRSLEALILDDDRAVCMANFHLEQQRSRLTTIPADGETIPLVSLGTHSRGALFLDGFSLVTPELEASIDAIARATEGFFFGRFDVRVPDATALRSGRDLRVIELNGVTSESTHIYHPGTPLRAAYKTLFAQWKLAFRIGLDNVELGHAPSGVLPLLRALISRMTASPTA